MARVLIRSAEHVAAAKRPGDFPRPGRPEVAFLGRSNVGKSSLLNRLVGRKQLARTSGTPGKTRLIHFYAVTVGRRELLLVDLPGYGYARVARRERENWWQLVEQYLDERRSLRVAILLQDLRREPCEDETLLLEWLAERAIPSAVALTKVDKLKPMRREQRVQLVRGQLGLSDDRLVSTSAETGRGIDALWRVILDRLEARG